MPRNASGLSAPNNWRRAPVGYVIARSCSFGRMPGTAAAKHLRHVPGDQFRLLVGRHHVPVEPAPEEVPQLPVGHARHERAQPARLPVVVERRTLMVIADGRRLASGLESARRPGQPPRGQIARGTRRAAAPSGERSAACRCSGESCRPAGPGSTRVPRRRIARGGAPRPRALPSRRRWLP